PVDVQLLRKRALAVTRREQTDGFQRAERVADRPAADAEPSGELALGGQRQACGEGAVENQHSDAVGDLLGDTRLSDRLDHERLSLRGPLPGTARPLDTPRNGCQTHPPDWFDHRATLTHCGSRNADCGLRIKLRIGIAGRDLKQPIFNSIRNPQSAVRDPQYQGGFWSSSQTDRPSSCHARSRNTPAARAMSPPSSYRGRATPRRCPWRSPRSRATGGPSSTPTSARFTSSTQARSGPPGDSLKDTGTAVAVARAELSEEGQKGSIQIDGTARSNCGAGLQEQVSVAPVESAQAVAVRFSPLWEGAAPAIIAPERMLED